MTAKRRRLRQLIASPEILVLPGIYDGLSARIVDRAGFEAALVTGSGLSESRLGRPDVGLLTLSESAGAARELAQCAKLLLIADADTGYGNAVNVHFAVRAFEQGGVHGVMLEDQVWPKRCGHLAGKELISTEEMVGKVRAAVEARSDPEFVVMARTDAAGPLGIDEAIERATAYADAGADLLFADALLSGADIKAFAARSAGPVAVNMGFGIRARSTTPLLSARRLQELGVAVVIVPRLLTAAAVRGMEQALEAFRESLATGVVVEHPELLVSFEELHDLMRLEEIVELERRYLPAGRLAAKYGG